MEQRCRRRKRVNHLGGISIGPSARMQDPVRRFVSSSRDENMGLKLNPPSPAYLHSSASRRGSGDSGDTLINQTTGLQPEESDESKEDL